MQAVDSAYALARTLNTSLDIYWVSDPLLFCPFHKLWEIPEDPTVQIYESQSRPLKFWRTHPQIRRLPLEWLHGPVTFAADKNDLLKTFTQAPQISNRDILIESYSRFYHSSQMYSIFTPIRALSERIDERVALFGSHTIGVHVRRTDHAMSIRHSPDDAFIQQMHHEIEATPDVTFYLATDDMHVKSKFTSVFGERVITTTHQATRSSEEGVQEALVELYALSKTVKILGSYWSSFSKVAGELGGIEVIRMLHETR